MGLTTINNGQVVPVQLQTMGQLDSLMPTENGTKLYAPVKSYKYNYSQGLVIQQYYYDNTAEKTVGNVEILLTCSDKSFENLEAAGTIQLLGWFENENNLNSSIQDYIYLNETKTYVSAYDMKQFFIKKIGKE